MEKGLGQCDSLCESGNPVIFDIPLWRIISIEGISLTAFRATEIPARDGQREETHSNHEEGPSRSESSRYDEVHVLLMY